MRHVSMMMLAVLFTGVLGSGPADSADRGSQVSVRFPAFALSPGERISGVKLTSPSGRIFTGCRPNRWTCDSKGDTIHCYTLHPTYAIGISGMLPEFIIRNSSGGSLSLQASVEFLDNDGKEYSKEFRESDLIIK